MPRGKRGRTFAKNGRRGPRAGRVGGLAGANQAVASLEGYRCGLLNQRAQLEAQILAVDNALKVMGAVPLHAPAAVGGPRKGRGGRRGPRAGSLKEYILNVLGAGRIMSVKDITAGVLSAGYKTKNKTLAKSVGIALAELPSATKVGRGKFRGR